ncbi:fasciclin domain-containing protein [Lewinella sp. IMCC34183]|uniref:fasciclin domain-containing protein n=1 Tax=Lewinella sp. IMCC34183 TaxID=2248762 RepID=UPI000E269717|nr:fasciclin domain-containing protein [Lewinella sp. IMCC34183]
MYRLLPLCLFLLLGAHLGAQGQTVVQIIADSENHTTLETAITTAELAGTLSGTGPFTVFAPTDAAFDALPDGALEYLLDEDNRDSLIAILQYHVVPGDTMAADLMDNMTLPTLNNQDSLYVRVIGEMVMINGALVTMTDLEATNGTVHVIDAVLMPPAGDIGMVIMETDTLSMLSDAITAAGIGPVLSMAGPYTVFAPNDGALMALPEDQLNALLANPSGDLATILQYHVVPGAIYSGDLMDGMTVTTVQGEDLMVTVSNDSVFVNDYYVSMPDMMADNGVVHVIDGVLIPPSLTSTREPAFASEVSIAPNPATSLVTVNLPYSILNNTTLTLRDFNGRTVLTRRASSDREPLQLGRLPAGAYLLEIRASEGVIQRKIMVQR